MRSEPESTSPDLGVVTRTDVDVVVRNRMTTCTNILQSQVVEAAASIFKDATQESYFNSNNGLEFGLGNVVEQVLGKVIRPSRAITVPKVDMSRLV